jgi:Mitochondrial ribosomal protein L27
MNVIAGTSTLLRRCCRVQHVPILQPAQSLFTSLHYHTAALEQQPWFPHHSLCRNWVHPLPQLQLQVRFMSKFVSKSAKKRLTLTTKRAHKGFYKGKGCRNEGRINSKGRFIVNKLKQLELVVPDLTGFKLKPYIASSASRFPPEERHNPIAA